MDHLQRATRDYYSSDVVHDWLRYVYGHPEQIAHFPFGWAREMVVRRGARMVKKGSVAWDLGCGGGQLLLTLARLGKRPVGFDFSPAMVEAARELLAAHGVSAPVEIADVLTESFDRHPRPRLVIAMGLVEYFESPAPLLARLQGWLSAGAVAMIEFRNRLFNAVSGNAYTVAEARDGGLAALVDEICEGWSLEPVTGDHIRRYAAALATADGDADDFTPAPALAPALFPIDRRMHTPKEIEAAAGGFRVEAFWGLHPHPFPPAVEAASPALYNRIAWRLQGQMDNPLVKATCSSMVAVLRRR